MRALSRLSDRDQRLGVLVRARAARSSACSRPPSARYGPQVAFLGADTDDSAGDARTFLAQHPVSYPSYETTTTSLASLAAIQGLPTTIFVNPAGKVVYVHTGQYDSQGTLDQDIASYALPADHPRTIHLFATIGRFRKLGPATAEPKQRGSRDDRNERNSGRADLGRAATRAPAGSRCIGH